MYLCIYVIYTRQYIYYIYDIYIIYMYIYIYIYKNENQKNERVMKKSLGFWTVICCGIKLVSW